jgi:hypothetical protein
MVFFCFCKKNKKKAKLKNLKTLIEKVLYNAKARVDFAALVPMNQEESNKIEDRKKTLHKTYLTTREKIMNIEESKHN